MLFLIGSEARRRQGRFLSDGILMVLGILFLAIVTVGIVALVVDFSPSAPAQPAQTEGVNIGPAPMENPPAQSTEPEVIAPATNPAAWPIVQVVWTPVTDLSILPPAEQGFYNGTMQNSPSGSTSTPEWGTYARRIISEYDGKPVLAATVAAARDSSNKQIVLAGLGLALGGFPEGAPSDHLFLSTDGEKTWREINSTPPAFEGAIVTAWETRIISQNGVIRLFARAGGGGIGNWWTATAP